MFCSTRGTLQEATFSDTLLSGWICGNELFVPQSIKKLDEQFFVKCTGMSYKELSEEIFILFGGESLFSREEYGNILQKSFDTWPKNIIPVKSLTKNIRIMELFHGPSFSFKDVSLSVIGNLLNEFYKSKNKHCLNYTVTSGDTGSAVIECTKNKSNIDSLVFFPSGDKITEFQRLLMSTQGDENIHNFDSDCLVDDFDHFVSGLVDEIKRNHPDFVVSSLNSILWMRIMLQVVHVFYTYFQAVTYPQELNIVLPGGGLGHTTACLLAKKLGLPIIINIGFNTKNQNTYNFFNGKSLLLNAPASTSLSPAIDIQYPTNMERIIYILSNGNTEMVKSHMEKFYSEGSMIAAPELLELFKSHFNTFLTSDAEILQTMKKCYEEFEYIIDPHTAVGFHHYSTRKPTDPTSYMACASPIKFLDVLSQAGIPISKEYEEKNDELRKKQEYVTHLPDDRSQWREFVLKYIDELVKERKSKS